MSQKKRTFINSDEVLIVKGSLIVQGEFIQKETTVVESETEFQGDTLIINSNGTEGPGGDASSATLEFRTRDSADDIRSYTITLDPSNPELLVFSGPVEIPELNLEELNLEDLTKINVEEGPEFEYKSDSEKIEFTGTSASTRKLEEPITIGVSGDMTGSVNFQNAGATKDLAITLNDVNTDIGTWGQADELPVFTVNSKGLITGAENVLIDITASQVNDFTDAIDAYLSGTNGVVYNNQTGVIEADTDVLRTFHVNDPVGDGENGLTYVTGNLSVDSTVVRTIDNQIIGGEKTFQADATFESDVEVQGQTEFQDEVTLRSAVTVDDNILISNDTDIVPATDSTVNLGTDTNHLGNVFTHVATIRNINLGGNAEQTIRELLSGQDGINYDNTTGEFEVDDTVLRTQWVDSGLTYTSGNLAVDSDVVRTFLDQTIDGKKTFQADATFESDVEVQGDLTIQSDVLLPNDITFSPATDSTVDLGTSTNYLGNLFVDSAVIRNFSLGAGGIQEVRDQFSGEDGINYDSATGEFEVDSTVLREQWVTDGLDIDTAQGNLSVDATVLRTQWVNDHDDNGLTYSTGNISVDATVIRTGSSEVPLSQTIYGNLDIVGNLNSVTQVDLYLEDNKIILNKGNVATDAHIKVSNDSVQILDDDGNIIPGAWEQLPGLRWNNSLSEWQFSNDGDTYYPLQTYPVLQGGNAIELTSAGVINAQAGAGITVTSSAIELTPSGVTAGTYGQADELPVFTVDQYGRITESNNLLIDITASQVNDFTDAMDAYLSGTNGVVYNNQTGVIEADTDVVRTFGEQAIAGEKTFQSNITLESNVLLPNDVKFIPATDSTVDLGTSSNYLGNLFVDSAVIRNLELGTGSIQSVRDQFSGEDGINYDSATGEFEVDSTVLREQWVTDGLDIDTTMGNLSVDATVLRTQWVTDNTENGLVYSTGNVAVAPDVVRTFLDQTITGNKQFTDRLVVPASDDGSQTDGQIFQDGTGFYGYIEGIKIPLTPTADIGTVITALDAASTGVEIYAGNNQLVLTPGNQTVEHAIKTITVGTNLLIDDTANVITISANVAANRGDFSANTVGSFGSLTYNQANGRFTLTTPTTAQIRQQISATGLVNYDSATGVISTDADLYTSWSVQTDSGSSDTRAIQSGDTLQILGGQNITVTNAGNVITIQNDNPADITGVQAGAGLTGGGDQGTVTLNVGAGNGITVNASNVALTPSGVSSGSYGSANAVSTFTVDQFGRLTSAGTATINITSSQVSNFTSSARNAISVTSSGPGSLSYNSSTGVITYTGISQSEANVLIDARVSGGAGLTYTSGVLNVGAGNGITVNAANIEVDYSAFSAGTGIAYDGQGKFSIGQNVDPGASVNFVRVTGLDAPESGSDAVNKEYADALAVGLQARTRADVLVDFNIPASYFNGPEDDGVDATLTASSNGAFPSVDGVPSEDLNQVGTRFIINNQTNAAHNGLYVNVQSGSASQPWILRRCVECDEADEIPGSFVFIRTGEDYGGTGWTAVVDDPLTFVVGTDAIAWNQFSGVGTYTAGPGLTLDNTEFSVVLGTGLNFNGNAVRLNPAAAGAGMTHSSGVLNVGAGVGITVNSGNVALTPTSVSTGTYGNASTSANFTVDQFGRLTSAGQNTINITSSQVSNFTSSARGAISVTSSGPGSLAYNSSTGVITYTGITQAQANVLIDNRVSGGAGLTYTSGTLAVGSGAGITVNASNVALTPSGVSSGSYGAANTVSTFTVDQFGRLTNAGQNTINITSSQVSNFTSSARGAISVSSSGPGSLSYNSSTGVISYSGITQAQANTLIDARISGGAGLTYTSGTLAVGAGAGITVNAANVALTPSGVTSGSYGAANTVSTFTVDQFGRLTEAGTATINIAANQIGSGTIAYARLPDIRFQDISSGAYLTSSQSFSNSNSLLMTAAAIDSRIQSYGYGTIQTVTGGNGLTGTGSAGTVTLNVGSGDGITVNPGNVAVDGTVVRTSRTISTSGIATGGGNLTTNRTINVPGTNLGITGTGDARTITSSTGNNVSVPVATTTTAGFMASGDKSKLDGIAAGAQVNVGTNLGSSGTGGTRTITSSTGTNTSITYTAADVGAPPTSRTITAGDGLSGGGNLSSNRTLSVDSTVARYGTGDTTVRTNAQLDGRYWVIGANTGYAPADKDLNDYTRGEGGYLRGTEPNSPPGNSVSLNIQTIAGYGSGDSVQLAFPGRANNRFLMRVQAQSEWNNWFEFWHSGNSDAFNSSGTYSGLRAQATTKADVGLSGIPNTNGSTANFLRGDGSWATPPNTNTTYAEITTAEIDAGTASTLRTISGRRMKYALDKKSDTGHGHVIGDVTGLQAAIDSKANTSTQVIAGTGLSGGGTLAANRTLSVTYGTTAGTAAQGNDSRIVNATPNTRTITAGNGLTGGGNLTANRTITLGEPETITTSSTNSVSTTGHSHALTLPASATRGEISTANIINATSSALGFISGRRMNDALTNYGAPFSTTGTYTGLTAGSTQASLSPGSYLTGSAFNGSTARTWNVNATSANTASAIVARDGSGNFSANIMTGTATRARYADLAERYAIDQPAQPGTVVVFGGDREITQSTTTSDHRVVGVVSTDPAYLMNCDAGDDQTHPAIALTGRVPVRVTGEVNPGDLMVTSDIPGHAQADNDARPGRIIGKAIGKNAGGEGVIEVLITLM